MESFRGGEMPGFGTTPSPGAAPGVAGPMTTRAPAPTMESVRRLAPDRPMITGRTGVIPTETPGTMARPVDVTPAEPGGAPGGLPGPTGGIPEPGVPFVPPAVNRPPWPAGFELPGFEPERPGGTFAPHAPLGVPSWPGWPGRPDVWPPAGPAQPTPVGPIAPPQPYTQLAQTALGRLRVASRELLTEALQTVQAKQIAAEDLMVWLERRTRIGEVLSQHAGQWSADTLEDFALAFQMDQSRKAVMDTIVALAILNARDAEAELRAENMGPVTAGDLLQNRRVVFQYPPAGTPLEPPYVVLVAVEHQDTRRADDVVNSILGSLVPYQGYKLPREAAARLA